MMRSFTLLFLFFAAISFSQNKRFFYEYKFKTDSTSSDSLDKEMMVLDISKKGSRFISLNTLKSDSILKARIKANPESGDNSGITWSKVQDVVEKNYPDFSVHYFDNLDGNYYNVTDGRVIKWEIFSETQKIGNYQVQKATTSMYGRKWTAWFTTEIPIQDGPYKFHGLPGLILKIYDNTQTHNFEWKGISTLENDWIGSVEGLEYGQAVAINQQQYKKVFIENRRDPMRGMRAMDGEIITIEQNGVQIDPKTFMRDLEKRIKERNAKNNNILEIDLLKTNR